MCPICKELRQAGAQALHRLLTGWSCALAGHIKRGGGEGGEGKWGRGRARRLSPMRFCTGSSGLVLYEALIQEVGHGHDNHQVDREERLRHHTAPELRGNGLLVESWCMRRSTLQNDTEHTKNRLWPGCASLSLFAYCG